MNEFIKKLIERLEIKRQEVAKDGIFSRAGFDAACEVVNQLAEEYKEECCEWEYNEFEEGWETSCGTVFRLHESDRECTHFCSCCGKEIKVIPYQPKGE